MKICSIGAALVLCICTCLSAQYVFTPYVYHPSDTPTSGACDTFPFSTHTGWRFQFIYRPKPQENIPTMITDIAFAPCVAGTFTAGDFQIRMGHTTYNDFSSSTTRSFNEVLGAPTEVYRRGPVSWDMVPGMWCEIGLTTPFQYVGNNYNICVEIRYNATSPGNGVVHTVSTLDMAIPRAFAHSGQCNDPFNQPTWKEAGVGGPKHRFSVGFVMNGDVETPIGKEDILVFQGGPSNTVYMVAASLGNNPLPLGPSTKPCTINLTVDALFYLSIFSGPPLFNNYVGMLGPTGGGQAKLCVPNIPFLVGIEIYHAAVSYHPLTIPVCTNTVMTKITS